jgi:hypothetical protein
MLRRIKGANYINQKHKLFFAFLRVLSGLALEFICYSAVSMSFSKQKWLKIRMNTAVKKFIAW